MQLAILVAVLAALASAEVGGEPVGGLVWRLPLVALAMLVAPLAALVGAQRVAHCSNGSQGFAAHEADAIERLHNVVLGLWLAAVAVVLLLAQWPRIVGGNWELASIPLVDELAILAPVLGSLLLVWCALYRLERTAQIAALTARGIEPPPPRLAAYLALHIRHHLGLVVLPALAVVALYEGLRLALPGASEPALGFWVALPTLAAMLLLLPLVLRRIWKTSPLPAGPLREELELVCKTSRCRVRDILIWHTDGHAVNAAVVGCSRILRYVLLTDALLSRLSTAELAAVLRHELGHLRRGHLPLRLAMLLLPVTWWLAVSALWPETASSITSWLTTAGISPALISSAAVPLAMLVYAVLVVGWYSRLLEHDADLEACLDEAGRFDSERARDFAAALLRVIGRNEPSRFTRWLHPSLDERLSHLERAGGESRYIESFRRRLTRIVRTMILLYAAALALIAF